MKDFNDNAVLGKFTPAPPVQSEEMKAAYERIAELESALGVARNQLVTIGGNDPEGCQIQQYILSVIDETLS